MPLSKDFSITFAIITWHKIVLGKTIEEAGTAVAVKTEEKPAEGGEKVVKKRKWGSQSSSTQKAKKVTSMPISTDSLKVAVITQQFE